MKKVILVLIVLFVFSFLLGFVFPVKERNESTTPPTDFVNVLQAPENQRKILTNACYDCHSNNTDYPWYASFQPVGWWLENHVEHGTKHLNFSNWIAVSEVEQSELIDEIIEEVKEKHMPLKSYTWLHSEAQLSATQRNDLIAWLQGLRDQTY